MGNSYDSDNFVIRPHHITKVVENCKLLKDGDMNPKSFISVFLLEKWKNVDQDTMSGPKTWCNTRR